MRVMHSSWLFLVLLYTGSCPARTIVDIYTNGKQAKELAAHLKTEVDKRDLPPAFERLIEHRILEPLKGKSAGYYFFDEEELLRLEAAADGFFLLPLLAIPGTITFVPDKYCNPAPLRMELTFHIPMEDIKKPYFEGMELLPSCTLDDLLNPDFKLMLLGKEFLYLNKAMNELRNAEIDMVGGALAKTVFKRPLLGSLGLLMRTFVIARSRN